MDVKTVNMVYTSKRVINRYMGYIGYDTKRYENMAFDAVKTMCEQKNADILNMVFSDSANPSYPGRIFIHYNVIQTAFRAINLHDIIEYYRLRYDFKETDTLFIVNKDPPNDTIKKLMKQYFEKDKTFVVIQSLKQTQFYIHEHVYVPQHEVLSSEQEQKEVLGQWNRSNLPEICRFDPVAMAIAMRPGQICKITRNSRSVITEEYFYRYCV